MNKNEVNQAYDEIRKIEKKAKIWCIEKANRNIPALGLTEGNWFLVLHFYDHVQYLITREKVGEFLDKHHRISYFYKG